MRGWLGTSRKQQKGKEKEKDLYATGEDTSRGKKIKKTYSPEGGTPCSHGD